MWGFVQALRFVGRNLLTFFNSCHCNSNNISNKATNFRHLLIIKSLSCIHVISHVILSYKRWVLVVHKPCIFWLSTWQEWVCMYFILKSLLVFLLQFVYFWNICSKLVRAFFLESNKVLCFVSLGRHSITDRFYSALYSKILDRSVEHSTRQAMFLNLIYQSLRADNSIGRVKVPDMSRCFP